MVWQEPRTHLAKRLGISDVAIAKACRRLGIPMPGLGYWAKKRAGKRVSKMRLPPREPGVANEVVLGGAGYLLPGYLSSDEEIRACAPQPPVFPESLTDVRARVRKRLGKVSVPRSLGNPHRLIAGLLDQDETRREKQNGSSYVPSWEMPIFDSPLEKRRLRLLSGIFSAVGRCGAKPSIRGNDARELGVRVGDQFVPIRLEPMKGERRSKAKGGRAVDRLQITVGSSWAQEDAGRATWKDKNEAKLESFVMDIVEEVILAGERQYREGKERRYQWTLDRQRQLEEAERQRKETEARLERERLERIEKARLQRLIDDAQSHRQAREIRQYVRHVLTSVEASSSARCLERLTAWAEWARAQADELDPIVSGRFLPEDGLRVVEK